MNHGGGDAAAPAAIAHDNGKQGAGQSQSLQEWCRFVARCTATRLEPERLDAFLPILYAKHPLSAVAIADVFLRPTPSNHENLDPRVPRYIQILSRRRLIDTPSILTALYKYSTSYDIARSAGHMGDSDNVALRWGSSYAAEEVFFYRLTKAVGLGAGMQNISDAIGVCKVMAKWMTLFTAASAAFAQDVMGELHSSQQRDEMESARAAFVMLLLSVSENQTVLLALGRPAASETRQALSESLSSFIPSILQNSSQIAARLEQFRAETLASHGSGGKPDGSHADIDDLLDSAMPLENIVIAEFPIANSRAGLYIHLNASLVGRPLIDDHALYSYLHNKYQGDMQSTAIDLILASFDVLANAVFRSEGQKTGHLLRSYLINKVPLLLATLSSSMFPPLTAQFCITEALSQVDTNAFPTLSAMFDVSSNNNTEFTDSVRQDFCFACCLHGLIPESSIEGLLGEITYQSLPQGGRYTKENLVAECMAESEKIQRLVGELDNMDGNVGAVCQALTEVIARLCSSKETMTLKLLCSQLARKPLSLDVMLLFDRPHTILHPLCELLDNWSYEEDQGEYQPVYEEFGSILLLLLSFVNRYNLSAADLGIRSSDSFVANLLSRGRTSRSLDELTDQERSHLDGWIRGLFDNESGGLGDELMSSCPPQDFYMLVPTLFDQIVLAFGHNYLDEDGLKTGIEYLVDTFLATSLVLAITHMAEKLWLNQKEDTQAIIRVLQLILMTKQGSNEAQAMLSAVVNIVAKPLEHALRLYQRQNAKNQEIEPLLKAFKENIPLSRRTAGAGHNELESWTGTPGGGLSASIRVTFQGFVQWSLHPGINIMPTSYTHRQFLAALNMLGARRLLQVIVEEVKAQTDAGSGSIAYDVAVALICAPDVTNVPGPGELDMLVDPNQHPIPRQRRLSLREVLKMEAEDFKATQRTDVATAEILLRLHRKVEAQLLMPPPAQTMLEGELDLGLDNNAANSLNDALVAAQSDTFGSVDGNVNLDLGGAGNDMDFGGGSGDGTGGLDLGGDDDIFGGLGGDGGDLLDGWDGMDLS